MSSEVLSLSITIVIVIIIAIVAMKVIKNYLDQ